MGKFFELLGLASFNVLLVTMLSVSFLSSEDIVKYDALNSENVRQFITEVTEISSGQREDMDPFAITTYFMAHITEDGTFTTKLNYNLPNMTEDTRELSMDKMNFISHLLKGAQNMERYETRVDVNNIQISQATQTAEVMTTSYERGMMPVDDGFGDTKLVPVMGTSYCEQSIILNAEKIMQMSGAECMTDITFELDF